MYSSQRPHLMCEKVHDWFRDHGKRFRRHGGVALPRCTRGSKLLQPGGIKTPPAFRGGAGGEVQLSPGEYWAEHQLTDFSTHNDLIYLTKQNDRFEHCSLNDKLNTTRCTFKLRYVTFGNLLENRHHAWSNLIDGSWFNIKSEQHIQQVGLRNFKMSVFC